MRVSQHGGPVGFEARHGVKPHIFWRAYGELCHLPLGPTARGQASTGIDWYSTATATSAATKGATISRILSIKVLSPEAAAYANRVMKRQEVQLMVRNVVACPSYLRWRSGSRCGRVGGTTA